MQNIDEEVRMRFFATPVVLSAILALSTLAGGTAQAKHYDNDDRTAPAGSYQQTCTNIRTRGAVLTASCATYSGQRVRSSLAFASCRGTDIGNINGQLTCVRSGNGYGRGRGHRGWGRGGRYNNGYNNGSLPAGSYQQSCSNASMSGTTLTANCQAANGGTMTSYLDITQCRPTDDIGNLNGQLRCIYRQ
jgi:hypothetical protein